MINVDKINIRIQFDTFLDRLTNYFLELNCYL